MRFQIFLLLVAVEVVFGTGGRCCLPVRFEGQLHSPQTGERLTVAVDYELGREFLAVDSYSETFRIVDLNTRFIHRFAGGQCKSEQFKGLLFFERCLDDFELIDNINLSTAGNNIPARVFQTKADSAISRTAFLTVRDDGSCVPLFFRDTVDNVTQTFYLNDVIDTVTTYNAIRLMSDVSDCE